jgi:TnpA family transposase
MSSFTAKAESSATNRREDQEITMLSLHMLQLCLVYINTLMIQQVLHKSQWQARMNSEDLRASKFQLFWTVVI